jgi:ABC-2 type transport system permease protein
MFKRSILIWGSAISFGLIFYMMFFPLIMVENDAMDQVMQSFPEEFLAFFGMNASLTFTNVMGYFGLTMSFIYIPVAIQAALYGISILSVEEREFTADFLLSKPVSRSQIYISKFLAALTALVIVNIVVWISGYLSLLFFSSGLEVDYLGATLVLCSLIFIQLFFLTLAMLISVVVKKVTSVIGYAMGLGFGMFILSSFGQMLSLDILKLFTPYSHFEPISILVDKTFNFPIVLISVAVIIISFSLGFYLYQRKNIKAL